jgi:hypothetical protein
MGMLLVCWLSEPVKPAESNRATSALQPATDTAAAAGSRTRMTRVIDFKIGMIRTLYTRNLLTLNALKTR